jgi:type II secretory pathway pseudopilin PulG
MSGGFVGLLIFVLVENKGVWLRFWTIVTAGEVVAWRLKWVALPVAIAVLWSGARIIRSIKKSPVRFAGLRPARIGLAAATVVTVMIATLIGITIPERLRQRQYSIDAAIYAHGYTINRALSEYRELHGFIPGPDEVIAELKTLPDPGGAIAEALQSFDVNVYKPRSSELAAATAKSKPQALRGSALRNAATRAELPLDQSVSFTNYDLRLPGEDKILNTDDDLFMRDGQITKASDSGSSSSGPTLPSNP